MTYGSSNPPSVSVGMQHSGIDRNAAALTGKKHLMRQLTIETSGPPGKKRRVSVRTKKTTSNPINQSSNRHEESIYDMHLLANQGSQRLTSLTMKVGPHCGKLDHNYRFLKNLNQNGKVISQWNGCMHSDIDERVVTMQIFRHRLSQDGDTSSSPSGAGNTVQGPYLMRTNTGSTDGSVTTPFILWPQNVNSTGANEAKQNYTLTNPSTYLNFNSSHNQPAPALGDTIGNAFYDHFSGQVSFSAINRPDFEDMSWNLNKLKLKKAAVMASTIDDATFANIVQSDVQPYHINMHRRQSVIQQNNFDSENPLDLSAISTTGKTPAPYRYDAVLRHGTISYEFMNKNDTGATVEVIVYKVKKTSNLSANFITYMGSSSVPFQYLDPVQTNPSAPTTNNVKCCYPLNTLVNAIGRGYMNTIGEEYATENLKGRDPSILDIYSNPSFPLLPKLRKTLESTNPFVEVMRNKFVMTAGSRRSLDIQLPGAVYDPCGLPMVVTGSGGNPTQGSVMLLESGTTAFPQKQVQSLNLACIDNHSYVVVLACNGQKMTRFFDSKAIGPSNERARPVYDFPSMEIGLDPSTGGAYQWFLDYDAASPTAMVSGTTYTCNIYTTHLANNVAWEATNATADVVIMDYLGSVTPPSGFTRVISSIDNFVINGVNFNVGTPYTLGPPFVSVTSNGGTLQGFIFHMQNRWDAGQIPTELPMGDNHGSCLVNYTAKYTEHIGACLYKDTHEKNLWDCGQPNAPELTNATGSGSTTGSRLILPATQIVRQERRVTRDLGSYPDQDPISVSTDVGQQMDAT